MERRLVRRMLAGDEAAFEQFSNEYVPQLYRFALYRLGRDRELTRDIVQSTVCKAIDKLATFRGKAALMTWLCACCRNEIAAHFRYHQRLGREMEFSAWEESERGAPAHGRPYGPEGSLLRKADAELVHCALDRLPPRYGRALEWKYLEELPVKEIARRLDIGPKAAESVLTRARQAFRTTYSRLIAGQQDPAATPKTAYEGLVTES